MCPGCLFQKDGPVYDKASSLLFVLLNGQFNFGRYFREMVYICGHCVGGSVYFRVISLVWVLSFESELAHWYRF